jgi:hypothetical protein
MKMDTVKKMGVLALFLVVPAVMAIDIHVNLGGGGGCAPGYPYPIYWPAYSYGGFVPYYYSGPYPAYRYGSGSYGPGGRTIRLGEEHDEFWDRHGGFEAAHFDVVETSPWPLDVPVIDRRTPLQVGDAERRIRDLDMEVSLIVASGDTAIYHLMDGRKVTAEGGLVVEIAAY